jgi:hypothetical protein
MRFEERSGIELSRRERLYPVETGLSASLRSEKNSSMRLARSESSRTIDRASRHRAPGAISSTLPVEYR